MAAVTQMHTQQPHSHSRVHQPRPRLPSHGHNHNHSHRHNHSHSNSRSNIHSHSHSHNYHHPNLYTQPMMSQSHVHLPPPIPVSGPVPAPSQPHALHPASFSSLSSSYAPYPAAYPSYDTSTNAMLMYPPFTASASASFPSSIPSAFSAPLAVPQPQPQLSHPLQLTNQQQQQQQQSMLQQGLSQQHLALLMQHAWLQQQQQQQQQQKAFPPSTSAYPSHCFPSTSYPVPLPYPVSLPSLFSVPLLTHAHMHTPMDSSWIYAHTSPSDSNSNISSASSSRTCSPTYHLPCTGCDGVCTCSHLLAPTSHSHAHAHSHSHSHSQPHSCTSQASIGTSIESPEPRSYSPPALMLPPILIPPQPRSVHSAVIHRSAGSRSGSDEEDEDEDESSDGDSVTSSTNDDDNVAQALASTHLSETPPLTLTSSTSTSTSTSSSTSNSSFSGSIRNNFETPLMIIDDEDSELVHVISPSVICSSTPSSARRIASTRMRSMTVMGMLMAASQHQRQATTPHPARPQRLSQRMSILRPMAMSTPVSPVDHTRDRDYDHAVDDVQTSTIPTVPVSTSFEAPTSLSLSMSLSLSPLHPLEWPISSSDVDDKCDEYVCDDEYDKCTSDFSIPSRVTYQLPTKQDEVVKSKPFSYADVVRAKQPQPQPQLQPQPTRDGVSSTSTSHSHSHIIHQVTRVPHVATRA